MLSKVERGEGIASHGRGGGGVEGIACCYEDQTGIISEHTEAAV